MAFSAASPLLFLESRKAVFAFVRSALAYYLYKQILLVSFLSLGEYE